MSDLMYLRHTQLRRRLGVSEFAFLAGEELLQQGESDGLAIRDVFLFETALDLLQQRQHPILQVYSVSSPIIHRPDEFVDGLPIGAAKPFQCLLG